MAHLFVAQQEVSDTLRLRSVGSVDRQQVHRRPFHQRPERYQFVSDLLTWVPAMHTAYEVVAANRAVGHQRAAVQASAIENRHVVVAAHDYHIGAFHHGPEGLSVGEVVP